MSIAPDASLGKSNTAIVGIRIQDGVLSTSLDGYASYSGRFTNCKTEGCMRLVLFEGPGSGRGVRPGVWTDNGVVDVSSVTNNAFDAITPQQVMEGIIDNFDDLKPEFEHTVEHQM